jgi:integrase
VSRVVYGPRREAEVALAKLRVADHQHRLPMGKARPRSVRAVLEAYLSEAEAGRIELASRTLVTSRSAVRTMSSARLADGRQFGELRLSELTWERIEDLYSALRASGRGADWVRRCATVLNRSLEQARKRGTIDSNPCRDANRPRTTRSKPFAPTAIEVRDLVEAVSLRDPELGDAALILASTAMRKGELLGLQWADVDLTSAEVHVAAAISDGGPRVGVVRKPTKRSDWRDVPLTGAAVAAFQRQAQRRKDLTGSELDGRDYIFCAGISGAVPLRPDSMSDRWAAARGSSQVSLLHLRHYAATAMLDAGESYRTVAELLGNSESTLRLHYDGRTDVGKRRAIGALELT